MTLTDLFDTMWSIVSVCVDCRMNGRMLHTFYFSPEYPHGDGLRMRIAMEAVSYIVGPVNEHGRRKKNGQSEFGWGYLKGSIPKELMNTKINALTVGSYSDGYHVLISAEVDPLTVEVLRTALEKKKWRASDERL